MRQFYFCLFMAFSFLASGQETMNTQNPQREEIEGFKLYPNPVYDNVVYVITKDNDIKDIIVYDVFGEVVITKRISGNILNISQLVPGVYVLQVTENKKTISRKLVVK